VFKSTNEKVKYRPLDLFSTGIGFTYKGSWVADIGLRVTNNNDPNTSKRIDFQTSVLLDHHLVDLGFSYYQGFEEVSGTDDAAFRDDIKALTINLQYLYFPQSSKTTYSGSRSGLGFQRKNAGSLLVGGFMQRHVVQADSSLIPSWAKPGFDLDSTINEINFRSLGGSLGYAQFVRLSENFYIAALFTVGLGVGWGKEEFEPGNTKDLTVALGNMKIFTALGYNWRRIYAIANYTLDTNYLGLEDENSYNYYLGRVKLAVGYKFYRNDL
jgi:hypothetical protein